MRASQTRLYLVVFVAALCCSPAVARERPATTPAARFLQDMIERAFDLSRPPVSPEDAEELDALIGNVLDWPSLARFAAGRYRAELNADGMAGIAEALARQLEVLARRAGAEWPAMTVTLRNLRIDAEGNRSILSTAMVPRLGEVEIEWTLVPSHTAYRILEIRALGMSLRHFLRGWVASLVAAKGGDAAAAFGEGAAASPR